MSNGPNRVSTIHHLPVVPFAADTADVTRLLPKVLLATALVAVAPVVLIFELQVNGVIGSPILADVIGAALSLVIYHLAAARWQRREGTHDVLFGELMIWGWIGRCIQERRIANASKLLGARVVRRPAFDARMSPKERVALLQKIAGDLEVRDPYTHGHSRRVARYTTLTAKAMGITGPELRRLRTAAFVHDLGKIDTPIDVLCKPGKLTAEEYDQIKRHPADGERMVDWLDDEMISAVVRSHHERLDGSGYPDALRGDEIPLGARIVAVADTFDAITSTRSYRGARTHKQALDIIQADAGTKLDADAVAAFRRGYLGRRSLATWIAFSNVVDRIILWIVGDAIGSGVRLAAFTASAVALGSGVLPADAKTGGRSTRGTLVATASSAAPASSSASRGGATDPVIVLRRDRSALHRASHPASHATGSLTAHRRGHRAGTPTTPGTAHGAASTTSATTTTTPGRNGRGHYYGQTQGRKVRRHGRSAGSPAVHHAYGHAKTNGRSHATHTRVTHRTATAPHPTSHPNSSHASTTTTATTTTPGNAYGLTKGNGAGK